jgi:hypothetical protein
MTMETQTRSWRADLGWYAGLTLATGACFALGGGLVAGALAAAGMAAFTAVLAIGRRRVDALRVVGGAGDERNRALYTRSLATAGGALGLAVTGWFLVGVARGRVDGAMLVLTVGFAVVFVGSSVHASLRG